MVLLKLAGRSCPECGCSAHPFNIKNGVGYACDNGHCGWQWHATQLRKEKEPLHNMYDFDKIQKMNKRGL
jgi:hypothetical protein